jgi:hypothetical protein
LVKCLLEDTYAAGIGEGFEGLYGGVLLVLQQATVTGYVGAEDGGELAVKAFRFHADTSLARRFGKIQDERGESEINPVRSEPLNETSVRFRSGGNGEIYNPGEIYLNTIGKIK